MGDRVVPQESDAVPPEFSTVFVLTDVGESKLVGFVTLVWSLSDCKIGV